MPGDWGVSTQKKDKVYVHVLHWNSPLLALPPLGKTVKSAHSLIDNAAVTVTQNADGVVLKLPATTKGEVDRVVVLEF
jgi:alpha-L-fucosidase